MADVFSHMDDFTYGSARIGYFTLLEPTLGIINCCLPVLPPVYNKLASSRFLGWGSKSQGSCASNNNKGSFTQCTDLETGHSKCLDEFGCPLKNMPRTSTCILGNRQGVEMAKTSAKGIPMSPNPSFYSASTDAIMVTREWEVRRT